MKTNNLDWIINYRDLLYKNRKKYNITKRDFEILVVVNKLCSNNGHWWCSVPEIRALLPTISSDIVYKSVRKLTILSYVDIISKKKKIRQPVKYSIAGNGIYLLNRAERILFQTKTSPENLP